MVSGIYAGPLDLSWNMFSRQVNGILDDAQQFATKLRYGSNGPSDGWFSPSPYQGYYSQHIHHYHWWPSWGGGYSGSCRSDSKKDDDANRRALGVLLMVGAAVTSYFVGMEWERWSYASADLSHVREKHRGIWQINDSFGHTDILRRISSTMQNVMWRKKFSAELGLILKIGLAVTMAVTGYGLFAKHLAMAEVAGQVLAWFAGLTVLKFLFEGLSNSDIRAAQQIEHDVALLRGNVGQQLLARSGLARFVPV